MIVASDGRPAYRHGMSLDEIDEQILTLLAEDARRTVTDIASRVSLSPAPVARRIERMERAGIIAGYTVVLDHSKVGPSLDAFTELRIVGSIDAEEVVEIASAIPEVEEIFTIAGDPDVLLRLRVDDVAHLQQVVNALRRSGKVTGTKTLMVLARWSRT